MPVFDNIRSVAKYESKLLIRSWFYRVFLILALLFLSLFNFAVLVAGDGNGIWMMKAITSNIPYVNLLFLNTGQAVIAVFLSSEFLKSDKKLDTSEVFYVHPLSNAEYVAGKIWGNLNVFFRLDLMIIALVIVFNVVSGVSIDWIAYVTYFLLICVPTLIYIFGLSVSLMLILKNQAITFVILLGYIALTLFYIEDKFYYLFDYMVYNLPLVKSSIVGFTNWGALMNHRCIYFLLGSGFLCLSIFLFRRLPNTKYGRYRWLVLSGCFLIAGCVAAYNHVGSILKEAEVRALYTDINNKYVHTPKMVVDSYDIRVEQHPETISSEVVMKGVALESSAVFTFCLNPSLQVHEIKENGRDLSFNREHQIIRIDFGRDLDRGDTVSFTMKYGGRIDGRFCYLDIPAEILQQKYATEMIRIDKAYSFQNSNYLLFTPETYWYPRPGTSYSSDSPDWQQAYFSNFRLTVKTINGLRALSQGTMKWPIVKKPAFVPPRKKKIEKTPGPDSVKMADTTPVDSNLSAINRERPERRRREDSERGSGDRPREENERGQAGRRPAEAGGAQGGGAGRRPVEAGGAQGGGTGRRPGRNPAGEAGWNAGQGERRRTRDGEQGEAGSSGRGAQNVESGAPDERGRREPQRRNPERRERTDSTGFTDKDKERKLTEDPAEVSDPVAEKENKAPKDSLFIFETDFPSPSITLIIGDYEQKSRDVDSTEFSIWYLKGHDYFSSVFDSISDTIPAQIRERRRSIESTYSLDYSFNRFSVVEVPVQFYSYVRTWTQAEEKMQPEMVLFPEKGCLFNEV
ncbi:MAG: ABC transporter permease, partial [Tannerella sp.]|nr:ABC transporter permease [Tannerella sp.]